MPQVRIVDSITELGPQDAGCLAISGSHGGISSARFAAASKPLLSVFNDAGVGLDAAGIAGIDWLASQGLAACAVAHTSARIGVAQSTLDQGIISHANAQARALGAQPGQACRALVTQLERSKINPKETSHETIAIQPSVSKSCCSPRQS